MVNNFHEMKFVLIRLILIVDIIIVLDSEWLATKLISDLPSVKVITLPKSGGVSFRLSRKKVFFQICVIRLFQKIQQKINFVKIKFANIFMEQKIIFVHMYSLWTLVK
jgi:hypothetical protein